MSIWPVLVNMITACICLFFSTLYHTYLHQSKKVCDSMVKYDYCGICLLIMGSCYPPIIYSFACEPYILTCKFFLTLITVSCIGGFISLLDDKLSGPAGLYYRGIMFITLGISGIAPLAYLYFINDPTRISKFSIYAYWVGGEWYIGGAIIQMLRVPERLSRSTFDIFGQSHQIFHVCVLIAAWIHFQCGLQLYHNRQELVCPIVIP